MDTVGDARSFGPETDQNRTEIAQDTDFVSTTATVDDSGDAEEVKVPLMQQTEIYGNTLILDEEHSPYRLTATTARSRNAYGEESDHPQGDNVHGARQNAGSASVSFLVALLPVYFIITAALALCANQQPLVDASTSDETSLPKFLLEATKYV